MSLPIMTAPPTAPVLNEADTFNARAFALVAWHETNVAEMNLYTAALPSVITGTDFSGTSTTSVLIGTGAKSFTTQTGKQFQIGQPLRVANTAAPANYMDGQVTAYNSGTGVLDINVDTVGGSGTLAAWTISLLAGGGGSFVTLTGAETLTNKTLTAPVISSISNTGTITLPTSTDTLVGKATTDTLTNKSLALGTNTVSGTTAQFNAALSDGDFATLAGTETLTNKTLTAPAINNGTITSATIVSATIRADCTLNDTGTIAAASPGFRGVPTSGQSQGSGITLALTDAGKSVPNTSGGWTVPANASIAFPVGTVIELFNNSASTQTVAITTDTLRWAGSTSTGTRTVAVYGSAMLVKRSSTMWTISGNLT